MRVRNHNLPSNPILKTTLSSYLASHYFHPPPTPRFKIRKTMLPCTFLLVHQKNMYIYPVLFSSPSSFVFYTNSRNTVQASSSRVPASELTVYSTPSASTSSCFCSDDSPPMNQTVGKHYSSPLAALFLIPAYSNSNSTVIIILKVTFRPSAIQREGSVYKGVRRGLQTLFLSWCYQLFQ